MVVHREASDSPRSPLRRKPVVGQPLEPAVPGDAVIRSTLREYLRHSLEASPETKIVEELGLCRGRARIDLAVVNSAMHGYEIKSDRDRLDRLPSQIDVYCSVFDRMTMVVGPGHMNAIISLLPPWWGVLQAVPAHDRVCFELIRAPLDNPARSARALAEQLWRDEALTLLKMRDAAEGVRSKPRPAIWDRVCEVFELEEISAAVRDRLTHRAVNSAPA